MSILAKIITAKKAELKLKPKQQWDGNILAKMPRAKQSFFAALQNPAKNWPRLIAEVKKGSPSRGIIRPDFDVAQIVKIYDHYADALSILTDEQFFYGSLENLRIARTLTDKPLLRKDFIIDASQIYEARWAGADAVLLLASFLDAAALKDFLALTRSLQMDALVEVHTEKELEKALKTGARIIGINNRNLQDFSIDLQITERLARLIPKDVIIVSESGLDTKTDLRQVKNVADAVLIGTAIMRSASLEAKLQDLTGQPQIKICGITNLADAEKAAEYGANYLGFIFYAPSPRAVSVISAQKIIAAVKQKHPVIKCVGVFVNAPPAEILEIVERYGLNVVQLHGEESAEAVESLKLKVESICSKPPLTRGGGGCKTLLDGEPTPLAPLNRGELEPSLTRGERGVEIWKAVRIKTKQDLAQVSKFEELVDGILLDTYQKNVYGGTGETFDWTILQNFNPNAKLILAGGIGSDNFAAAVKSCHPDILDISSRIESAPGKKDLTKMKNVLTNKNGVIR